jgi:hypothetical protein
MATTKTKRKQIEAIEATTVLNSVKDIDINDVVSGVNNLQVSVQKTLAELGATVTNKVQQMTQIDTAIELKKTRLKELFDIEKEAISIDEMNAQKQSELDTWELERQERQKAWEEEDAERQKSRKRDVDNWLYEFEQKKKRAQEEFDAEVARTKRNEQLRHEALERSWVEREGVLKSKEENYALLKAQVDNIDTKVAEAVKQGEARGFASAAAKYNHEIALSKEEAKGQKAVSDLRIASLNEAISNLHSQIESMETQLISARQDAKEVASAALASASNRQVADALQRVVDNQQSSPGKTK